MFKKLYACFIDKIVERVKKEMIEEFINETGKLGFESHKHD